MEEQYEKQVVKNVVRFINVKAGVTIMKSESSGM
jgi:hypothetical protein